MRMRGASILRRAGDHPEAHTVPFPPPSEGPRSSNRCPAQRDGEDRSIVLLEIVIAATTNVSFAKSLATDPELGGGVRPFFRAWITVGTPPAQTCSVHSQSSPSRWGTTPLSWGQGRPSPGRLAVAVGVFVLGKLALPRCRRLYVNPERASC